MSWEEWNAGNLDAEARKRMREETDKYYSDPRNVTGYHDRPYPVGNEEIADMFHNGFLQDVKVVSMHEDKIHIYGIIPGRCDIIIKARVVDAHDFYPGG